MTQVPEQKEGAGGAGVDRRTDALPDDEGKPKFGRLLIVLILTVLLLAVITWASEAYWS